MKNINQNSWIARQDLFGFPVHKNLNLNRTHNEHKTIVGGLCSIFFRVVILAFILLKITLLFSREKDSIRKYQVPTNFDKIGSLN